MCWLIFTVPNREIYTMRHSEILFSQLLRDLMGRSLLMDKQAQEKRSQCKVWKSDKILWWEWQTTSDIGNYTGIWILFRSQEWPRITRCDTQLFWAHISTHCQDRESTVPHSSLVSGDLPSKAPTIIPFIYVEWILLGLDFPHKITWEVIELTVALMCMCLKNRNG